MKHDSMCEWEKGLTTHACGCGARGATSEGAPPESTGPAKVVAAVPTGCPASLVRAMLNHFIASQELHAADQRGDGTYPATRDSWLLTLAAVEKEWVAWTQDNNKVRQEP